MMFSQLQTIDRAFVHIKRFSVVFLLACLGVTALVCYLCFSRLEKAEDRVLILYNGKVLEAFASERKENLPVELRDHIRSFHQYFFTLDPDEKAIAATVGKAFYLADNSAKKAYDNLRESGYFNNLISANMSLGIEVDSISLDLDSQPYRFRCYATQSLVRSSGTVLRKLVTQGQVRVLQTRSDHNPHGFLIQHWETLLNEDVGSNGRQP